MTTILQFTHDFRIDDHAGLAEAARGSRIVPVMVIDPAMTGQLRRSPRRAAYYCGAVAALERAIAAKGGRLIVRRGRTAATLRALARATGATTVVWSASYDSHGTRADRDHQAALEESGLRVVLVHDAPAVTPEETLGDGRGYRSFAAYFERWLQADVVPYDSAADAFAANEVPSETLPTPAEFGTQSSPASDADPEAIRARFARYVESEILSYAIARNAPAGGETSHLGAALSFGLISARSVVASVRARQADRLLLTEERMALRLFMRTLAQRDFFLQLGYFSEGLEDAPLQEKMRRFQFSRSHPALDAWRAGKTGFPLVDAGMRQLRATGWMHPRVRSIAASFLCFDLGVDWRVGRDEWDRWLIEDDPALAQGNWQWIAGVGADLAAYPRIYNPQKQGRRCDPAGTYVRRWIPELAQLSDREIFEPEGENGRPQLALPLFGDRAYPRPVVDHERAAREFLERYKREIGTSLAT